MRRLLIGVVVLAVLLLGGDFGLRLYSQSVAAGEIQASLKMSRKPSVSLNGFPFTVHLVSGNFATASAHADDVTVDRVPFRSVSLTLHHVNFPSHRLLSGGGGVIVARSGEGSATLTAAGATEAFRARGVPVRVAIRGGAMTAELRGLKVRVDASISGGSLVLRPTGGGASFQVTLPLPPIAQGLRYTGVSVSGGEAELRFALRDATIVIPG